MTSTATPHPLTTAPTLKLSGISKSFGLTQAVKGISLEIRRNEVVGLIGENGAGKSSLLKMLTGIYQPDAGAIEVNGQEVRFRKPKDATRAGIGVVHQEQSLLTNMSVAENIAMNVVSSKDAATRFGVYRWGRLNREASRGAGQGRQHDRPAHDRQRPARSWTGRWWRSPGRCASTS